MFIRKVIKKRKNGKAFTQFSLCQSARINGKPKQHTVLYLGSDIQLGDDNIRKQLTAILKNKIFKQNQLIDNAYSEVAIQLAEKYYQKYLIKYKDEEYVNVTSIPPAANTAEFHNVDIKSLEVQEVKTFGAEHLCKQVMEKLDLKSCLKNIGFKDNDIIKAQIAIIARAIFTASEHKTAQYLDSSSALTDCYNYQKKIDHRKLYKIADKLFANKAKIDTFLNDKTNQLFKLEDKLVIFDISNTYFETSKRNSDLAKFGRSKEKRSDCPLVVFAASINKAGFISYSKIHQGNAVDNTLLESMLEDLEANTAKDKDKTVVIDAGIADEKNLELINAKGYKYVCVARKKLKDYPIDENTTLEKMATDRGKQFISLKTFKDKDHSDLWMYVHSPQKKVKDDSITEKLSIRYLEEIDSIKAALSKKGGTKAYDKVLIRIGRAKQKYKQISHLYDIKVSQENNKATNISYTKLQPKNDDKTKNSGVYFIRTNYTKVEEKQLWNIYNTIREVEATFRCLKTDLQIRPVHHQNDQRVKSHIYLTILAYQLVNTVRHLLKQKNIKHDWQNIVRIMNTQALQTIILPTDKKEIHLCKPSQPISQAKQIYDATNCTDTQKTFKKYVVYH